MSHWEKIGQSDEWYTPKYIFDALGCRFDMDVAGNSLTHVPATVFNVNNSLAMDWSGFIWMNPPFGGRNGLVPWLDRFVAHGNGIALVPDRTSAPWFQSFARHADRILFVSPKVKFERPDGSLGKSPSTGTALIAIGSRGSNALEAAQIAGLGFLSIPAVPRLARAAA